MTDPRAAAKDPVRDDWHTRSPEDVLAQIVSSVSGLSATDAAQRLATNGPNELRESAGVSTLQMFLAQFRSLIVWILIAAGGISAVLGEVVDAVAILAIVVLNAVIGCYQEFNAEKSIAALKKMTAPQAKVRRDGAFTSLPASDVVAGDVLALEAGDLIAADARLLEAASLFTNVNLLIVVAISFGLQVWSQHNGTLGRFLKTAAMPLADGLLLLAIGAIFLLVLELVKVARLARRQGGSA